MCVLTFCVAVTKTYLPVLLIDTSAKEKRFLKNSVPNKTASFSEGLDVTDFFRQRHITCREGTLSV